MDECYPAFKEWNSLCKHENYKEHCIACRIDSMLKIHDLQSVLCELKLRIKKLENYAKQQDGINKKVESDIQLINCKPNFKSNNKNEYLTFEQAMSELKSGNIVRRNNWPFCACLKPSNDHLYYFYLSDMKSNDWHVVKDES